MRKIRIAQIGINYISHGREVFDTLKSRPDLFDIAGYCLVEDERERCYKKLSTFDGYPELTLEQILNDPTIEAVSVETDEQHLTKYACLAAEHSKHIHMEKPGSPDLDGFTRLVELQKKNNRVLHLGYMYRYNPTVSDIIERVKSGEFGDIFSVEAQMNCYHPEKVRKLLGEFPAGMMFYLGCHLVDLVLTIQGTPENIIPLNRSTGADGLDTTDYGMAVFEYKNGVSFVKTCATEAGGYMRRQLVISGSKGTVEIRPLEQYIGGYSQYTTVRECTDVTDWHTDGITYKGEVHDRYGRMLEAFAEYVQGVKTNPCSYDYELHLFKTILKACGENI